MFIHHMVLNSVHDNNYVVERKQGMVDYLFLHVKSPCIFILQDQMYTVSPPAVILIDRYIPHKYFSIHESYCDDYLHFSFGKNRQIIEKLTFPLNVPISISNDSAISSLLSQIEIENHSDSKYKDETTTLFMELLFVKITEQWELQQHAHIENPHYQDLLHVHNLIHQHPEQTYLVEELASMAHLSCSYFQVLYKKTFRVSCITDVIDVKIAQAKLLLTSTNLPVKEIAYELGYREVYHFIRQFKKSTGLTPLAFRKRCS